MTDPDLQIEGGGGGHPDLEIKEGGRPQKNFSRLFGPHFWSKNKGAGPSPVSATGLIPNSLGIRRIPAQ